MIVGAFVLPRTIVGMTEASATRRPSHAAHAQLRVDDRVRAGADAARADGVVEQLDAAAQVALDVVVALDPRAGEDLAAADGAHRAARRDLPRTLHARDERRDVLGLGQRVGQDARLVRGVSRARRT